MRVKALLMIVSATVATAGASSAQAQWLARGRVLTKDKKPWAGAQVVFVEELPEGFDRGRIKPHEFRVQADAGGNVRARLRAGLSYQAWAYEELKVEGDTVPTYRASKWYSILPGTRFEMVESAVCARTIIQLFGSEKGFDASKLRVEVLRKSAPLRLVPDASGAVELPLVPPSTYVQVVDVEGRLLHTKKRLRLKAGQRKSAWESAKKSWAKLSAAKRKGTAKPASSFEIEKIEIKALPRLLVRVMTKKDGKKQPVSGARVFLGDYRGVAFIGESDAEGMATCRGAQLPNSKRNGSIQVYRVECHAKGYAGREGQCAMTKVTGKGKGPRFPGLIEIRDQKDYDKRRKDGKPHIEFELKPAVTTTGRLLLGDEPLASLRLRILRKLENHTFNAGITFGTSNLVRHARHIVTDGQGNFAFERLRPGETFELVAYLDKRVHAQLSKQRWPSPLALVAIAKVPATGALELGDIDLAKLPLLELQALKEDGGPAKAAKIFAWARSGSKRWLSMTGSRLGRVALRCADTKTLHLGARAGGRTVRSETSVPPKNGAAIQLQVEPGVLLRGIVLNEKDEPLPGADVYASVMMLGDQSADPLAKGGTQERVKAGPGGAFSFRFDRGTQVFVYGHMRDAKGRTAGRAQQLRMTLTEDVDDTVLTITGAKPRAPKKAKAKGKE